MKYAEACVVAARMGSESGQTHGVFDLGDGQGDDGWVVTLGDKIVHDGPIAAQRPKIETKGNCDE